MQRWLRRACARAVGGARCVGMPRNPSHSHERPARFEAWCVLALVEVKHAGEARAADAEEHVLGAEQLARWHWCRRRRCPLRAAVATHHERRHEHLV